MNRIEFDIEALTCANCAQKIEDGLNTLEGVSGASINFTLKKGVFLTESTDVSLALKKAQALADKLEPGVKLVTSSEKTEVKLFEYKHYRILLGALLFVLGFVFQESMLFLVAYGLVGYEVLAKALKNLIHGRVFDENFLMSIATLGALYINEWPEAVAVMLFYQVGEFFQDRAVNHARHSIEALLKTQATTANKLIGNKLVAVDVHTVLPGDVIYIKNGDMAPLDVKSLNVDPYLDLQAITGESLYKTVSKDELIYAGAVNQGAMIEAEVIHAVKDSMQAKIVQMVNNASLNKAPTERFITKFASVYTPIVVALAMLVALLGPVFTQDSYAFWFHRALIFLVISCPCALVISIPLGFFGGIGAASKKGIYIKGGQHLDALNSVKHVVFDKTGTLSEGEFEVAMIKPEKNINSSDILKYAAYGEAYASHKLAKALLKAYNQDIDYKKIKGYHEVAGKGVTLRAFDKSVILGSSTFMEENSIKPRKVTYPGTIIHVAVDHTYYGYMVVVDKIKNDAYQAVKALQSIGKKVSLLSGDQENIAQKVASDLGMDGYYAEMTPLDKVEVIAKMEDKVLFVGDGLNDAPVIKQAYLGIAMGKGAEAAIEASDMVILNDQPYKVYEAFQIAKKTRNVVMQNIVLAISIKLLVMGLGVMGLANLYQAVIADVGVALLAIFNAMRILKNTP